MGWRHGDGAARPAGKGAFQPCNTDKFKLDGDNVFNDDIENEAIYDHHIAVLRERLAEG